MPNQALTISKVKNIYIMLLHAISKETISMVDHYLDDKLTKKIKLDIENNIKNNVRQVFRLPNITGVTAINEDSNHVTFQCKVRYITYYVNRKTNKHVSGDKENCITKSILLKFKKNNTKHQTLYSCPTCGAGLEINASSICPYCNMAIDERFSPYVLCSIV